MIRIKLTRFCILLVCQILWFGSYARSVEINVRNQGAKGDGRTDDYAVLQKAIDQVSLAGGGRVLIPNGTYLIKDKTLLIWGSNVDVVGGTNTILLKQGAAGWWGDLMNISGKIKNHKYYGSFGKSNPSKFVTYTGKTIPSKNITIKNITFRSGKVDKSLANNLGIVNSSNVLIYNCRFENAPQTNLGVVNDSRIHKNAAIRIENCTFLNAGDHNVRVISYERGAMLGNVVTIKNSRFIDLRRSSNLKEIKGKKVHIWYRAGAAMDSKLIIDNCDFDNSGDIVSTVSARGFSIKNSRIRSKIVYEDGLSSDLDINNNTFSNQYQSSLQLRDDGKKSAINRNNKFK
ncbi:glycosyl hydrolase family 28-related protein [Sphingobacterium pedocola]|uniref:Rhamnogalacturonase A/B/Epimerase-like pectate lyase domain-containing protein n=1 Tax=Sphingobacterium pedocola TaxID=2082722 RepID=A0ABR9T9N1_9SPHI|nr:glycosyl hydrolase family 28-related protein [Sphingobacterium pedocola]MBE8722055.1 hypothetical protein [Sphingobacterium pedocola]